MLFPTLYIFKLEVEFYSSKVPTAQVPAKKQGVIVGTRELLHLLIEKMVFIVTMVTILKEKAMGKDYPTAATNIISQTFQARIYAYPFKCRV